MLLWKKHQCIFNWWIIHVTEAFYSNRAEVVIYRLQVTELRQGAADDSNRCFKLFRLRNSLASFSRGNLK